MEGRIKNKYDPVMCRCIKSKCCARPLREQQSSTYQITTNSFNKYHRTPTDYVKDFSHIAGI